MLLCFERVQECEESLSKRENVNADGESKEKVEAWMMMKPSDRKGLNVRIN